MVAKICISLVFGTILYSYVNAQSYSSSGAAAGSAGNYLCNPFELARNPEECYQRSLSFSSAFPTFASPLPTPTWNYNNLFPSQFPFTSSNGGGVGNNYEGYFTDWRKNFENWQRNFQNGLQNSLAKMQQQYAELQRQAEAEHEEFLKNGGNDRKGTHTSFHSQSSSSYGDSSGTSESVMHSSDNSGSYTIRSSGLGVSSSSVNGKKTIKVHVPDPSSNLETKFLNDKEMIVEVQSPNDSIRRWISVKITSGENIVQNYHINRPDGNTILISN